MDRNDYDDQVYEGGQCPDCGTAADYRTCKTCGRSEWVIDCGHYDQPAEIADDICDYCYDALSESEKAKV